MTTAGAVTEDRFCGSRGLACDEVCELLARSRFQV
jgi:hypothetical protein